MSVIYWGTPVVVFRTSTGDLAALEDRCPHRGVPLSCGKVEGEVIRCGYHHFSFDARGQCASIPEVFSEGDDFRKKCSIARFFVRKAFGLIWISAVDQPFPAEEFGLTTGEEMTTGFIPLTGDVRVWMDHFMDLPHGLFVHGRTLLGSEDRTCELGRVSSVPLTEDTEFPVSEWLEFEFLTPKSPIRTRLYGPRLTALLMAAGAGAMRPNRIEANVALVAPFCQRYRFQFWSDLGSHAVEYWPTINPISKTELVFAYAGRFTSTAFWGDRPRNRIVQTMQKLLLPYFLERHIHGEDNRFLSQTAFLDRESMSLTGLDDSVMAMRSMLRKYAKKNQGSFPAGSLFTELYL